MRILGGGRAAVLLLAAFSATAQVAAPPEGVLFRDRDPAARVYFGGTDGERGRARLMRHIERHPDDSRGYTARAFAHSLAGDAAAVDADLAIARRLAADDRRQREILWSEGWIRLNLGDLAAANNAWIEAIRRHGGTPYWVPYTFALLAARNGEHAKAVAWFDVAATGSPGRWGSRRAVLDMTGHWLAGDRDILVALYQAWADRRDSGRTPLPMSADALGDRPVPD